MNDDYITRAHNSLQYVKSKLEHITKVSVQLDWKSDDGIVTLGNDKFYQTYRIPFDWLESVNNNQDILDKAIELLKLEAQKVANREVTLDMMRY